MSLLFCAESGERTVLVALNMSNHPHTVSFHLDVRGRS